MSAPAEDAEGAFERSYFERYYRDYAAQNPPWKLRFYRRVIERHAPARRPLELLDVGCGLGRFLAFLGAKDEARQSWRLHGTDLSRHAVEHDRAAYPAIDFRVAPATDRPFAAGRFDVVTAFDVIEHVEDLDAVAAAVSTMLKADGLFVFVVPVYDGLTGPIIQALDRDPTHVHARERGFWLDWAGRRFRVLAWWGMLRYLLPGGLYLHLPTRRFRRHTPAILVAARPGKAAQRGPVSE